MQQAFKLDPKGHDKGEQPGRHIDYGFPADESKASGIIMVGEAPGAEEAKLGRPFVGRSGQLLDKILARAEIDRKECLIANVFGYQPPKNKVDHFFISRRASVQQNIPIAEEYGQFGSAWVREQFAPELERLRDELAARQKKHNGKIIIIALGRTPLWALTGESGLLEKVGKPLPCKLLPGATVIPTFHPSFILRGNWGKQDEWLQHFLTALKLLKKE